MGQSGGGGGVLSFQLRESLSFIALAPTDDRFEISVAISQLLQNLTLCLDRRNVLLS